MHVIGGGIIPAEDARRLVELGVGAVFGPGTPTTEPIQYIRDWYARNRQNSGS
jgi:methylmalonyl-CoA mutase C-terminal domain/subunit